jgi:hypothetical protein
MLCILVFVICPVDTNMRVVAAPKVKNIPGGVACAAIHGGVRIAPAA